MVVSPEFVKPTVEKGGDMSFLCAKESMSAGEKERRWTEQRSPSAMALVPLWRRSVPLCVSVREDDDRGRDKKMRG